jgi:hypothetical protein
MSSAKLRLAAKSASLTTDSTPLSPAPTLAAGTADSAARRAQLNLEQLFPLRRAPGYYNAPAKAALLRRGRKPPHDQVLVDYSQPEILTELVAEGRTLLSSFWRWQATVDGRPLAATGPWEEVLWHTDSDVDFLEIELPLTDGWVLQRHWALARQDRILLMADALLGHESQTALRTGPESYRPEIHYQSSLAHEPQWTYEPSRESREGWLTAGRKRHATILPLALPEWRAERGHSELTHDESRSLQLSQSAQGAALYAPLLIDLDPSRTRQPLTWRRLTVAENLQIVRRDEAVGFRAQLGEQNWLIYRTLAPRGNRTVLGQNYACDFVFARLLRTGTTEVIIEVQ